MCCRCSQYVSKGSVCRVWESASGIKGVYPGGEKVGVARGATETSSVAALQELRFRHAKGVCMHAQGTEVSAESK